jgi:hypothetical protein
LMCHYDDAQKSQHHGANGYDDTGKWCLWKRIRNHVSICLTILTLCIMIRDWSVWWWI